MAYFCFVTVFFAREKLSFEFELLNFGTLVKLYGVILSLAQVPVILRQSLFLNNFYLDYYDN